MNKMIIDLGSDAVIPFGLFPEGPIESCLSHICYNMEHKKTEVTTQERVQGDARPSAGAWEDRSPRPHGPGQTLLNSCYQTD